MNRRGFIGGSDVAALVCGLGLDVWLRKTGRAYEFGGNAATELGNAFEDPVAKLYSKVTGNRVRRRPGAISHPDHPWAVGHIDRQIVGVPGLRALLEVKCSSRDGWGPSGSTEIPDWVLAQAQWYAGIGRFDEAHIAALLWGGYGAADFRTYTIPADPELFDFLLAEASQFWRGNVEADVPPAPQSSAEASRLWSRAKAGARVVVGAEVVDAIRQLEEVKARLKLVEAERDALELRAKVAFQFIDESGAMQSADHLVTADGEVVATWKEQTSNRLDIGALRAARPEIAEEFTREQKSRVLRVSRTCSALKQE